jgi:hypothetical protein
MNKLEDTYCVINDQNKIKILTKLFTYLIYKNIESIKFNVVNDILIFNNNKTNQILDFNIKQVFFDYINIVDKDLLQFPIINIIKDLKSYKGKKVFPNVYFIFKKNSFTIKSIYPDTNVELLNIVSGQYFISNTLYKLDSIITNKEPDLIFELSIEKLNILLNNTYVKELSELLIIDNQVIINFNDTHNNIKSIKSTIKKCSDYIKTKQKLMFVNIILKDLMRFFKDNIVLVNIYLNEEKIVYNVLFSELTLSFKLTSSIILN